MKDVKEMTTTELINLADKIKKGMGKTLLKDYKRLKKSFRSILVR